VNVLFICDAGNLGGIETHILTSAQELQRNGHKVVVVSSNPELGDLLDASKIKHYTLNLIFLLEWRYILDFPKVLLSVRTLLKILQKEDITIIHSHGPSTSAYVAFIVSQISKVPLIYSIHSKFPMRIFWTFLKRVEPFCPYIIAISDEVRVFLVNDLMLTGKKIKVVYNGIDLNEYKQSTLSDSNHKLLHISRLDPEKVVATLKVIEAIRDVIADIPDIELVIIGSGEKFEQVKLLIETENRRYGRDVLRLIAGVEPSKIPQYIHSSSIVIGAGRVALEAMACEKPVVCISSGGFGGFVSGDNSEMLIRHNFSGRGILDIYTSNDVANSLTQLLNNPEMYFDSKVTGKKIIKMFDLVNTTQEIERIYSNIKEE